MKLYKKILLATDGSEHANNAAKKAVEFQKIWDSEVVVIHSIKDNRIPSELYPNIDVLYAKYSSLEEVYKDAGTKLLNKTKRMFGDRQSSVETRLIEKEAPEDYIRRIVEEEKFDLVVLGSRGQHSKVKKVLLGSVSSKVSRNAPCDVLIIK
ncbi:MAG: universal stress protein [Promethearchaeota archaeon]|jgi:nucleotide-binding universal stress UspA family protein